MADEEKKTDIPVDDPKEKKIKKIEKLKEDVSRLEKEVEYWKNEYYRAYADTQNLRKSLEKDHQNAMKYRAEGFIDNLLPILDSFHVVLSKEPEDPNLRNYLVGFQFIYRNLVSVLENEGVNEIAPKVGDKFNASTMNAVEVEESDGEEGLITKVITNGYKLHEHLIRPAMVIVSIKEKIDERKEETQEKEEAHEVDA